MTNGEESYRRFLAGEENAMVELVAAYYDGLVLFLLPLVRDPAAAEDLAEDTFLRLYLKKPKFKSEASFKTWLYTIARNLALDHLRKHKRCVPVDSLPELPENDRFDAVAAAFQKAEDRRAVRRAMAKIRPEYAQVLQLTYFEELSNKQAAAVLKKSVHAVENLNYRARLALKRQLESEGFVYEDL